MMEVRAAYASRERFKESNGGGGQTPQNTELLRRGTVFSRVPVCLKNGK